MGLPLLALLKSTSPSDTSPDAAIDGASPSSAGAPLLVVVLPEVDDWFSGDDASRGACNAARRGEYPPPLTPTPEPSTATGASDGALLPPAFLSAAAPAAAAVPAAATAAAGDDATTDTSLAPVLPTAAARGPVRSGAEERSAESSGAGPPFSLATASTPSAAGPPPPPPLRLPAFAAATLGRPARRREKARKATTAWLRRRCVSAGAWPVSWVTLRAWSLMWVKRVGLGYVGVWMDGLSGVGELAAGVLGRAVGRILSVGVGVALRAMSHVDRACRRFVLTYRRTRNESVDASTLNVRSKDNDGYDGLGCCACSSVLTHHTASCLEHAPSPHELAGCLDR